MRWEMLEMASIDSSFETFCCKWEQRNRVVSRVENGFQRRFLKEIDNVFLCQGEWSISVWKIETGKRLRNCGNTFWEVHWREAYYVDIDGGGWVNEGFLVCGNFLILGVFSVKREAEQRWEKICSRIEEIWCGCM